MAATRKLAKAFKEVTSTFDGLERLDEQNQQRFRSGPGRPSRMGLTASQFYLLTEGLFLQLFRGYERFIEDCFLIFMMGLNAPKKPKSFVSPRDLEHARSILKGGGRFLDWHSPDTIIARSELYFDNGGVIKQVLASNRTVLFEMKRVRDRIAHSSPEAESHFRAVLQARLLTVPTKIPNPGEFLQSSVRNRPGLYHLRMYSAEARRIFEQVAN